MKTHHKINTVILAATVVILLASITTLADNIYVSSGTSIIKIDSSGNKSTFASGPGVSLGLAFDRSGNLYASYEDTGTILKFDSSGNQSTFASGLKGTHFGQLGPEGLTFDSSGNLYAYIYTQGTILKFDPSRNKSTFALDSGLAYPYGLAFDSSGYLYVIDETPLGDMISKFDSNGNKSTFVSCPLGIECLAFDSHDNLYVSIGGEQISIMKYDPSGNGTVFATSINMYDPFGLAIDSSDNLYVASTTDNVIKKFDPAGNMSIVASVDNPYAIAIQIPEPCTLLLLGLGAAIVTRKQK